MKRNALKHQALSTLVGDYDQCITDLLDFTVPTRERAQYENDLLNKFGIPPGEHLDRWYNFLWGEGLDEAWLIFWKRILSPEDFRDVAMVAGLAHFMSPVKPKKARR